MNKDFEASDAWCVVEYDCTLDGLGVAKPKVVFDTKEPAKELAEAWNKRANEAMYIVQEVRHMRRKDSNE